MEYTGAPLAPIVQNLKTVNEMKIPFIVRLPIIPQYNDREDHFLKVKAGAKEWASCRGIEIMPYHKLGEYKYQQLGREYLLGHIAEPAKAQVSEWEKLLK